MADNGCLLNLRVRVNSLHF